MSIIVLELFAHGGALVATHKVAASHVPRVGETIDSPRDAANLEGVSTLLVLDVVHRLEGGTLTPVLRCWESADPEADRLRHLRDGGWLAPQAHSPGDSPQ